MLEKSWKSTQTKQFSDCVKFLYKKSSDSWGLVITDISVRRNASQAKSSAPRRLGGESKACILFLKLHRVFPMFLTVHEVAQVIMPISHWDFEAETAWRVVGLMSSVVGLLCYALSPSFNRLIGRWKPFKFFLYGALSFEKQASLSTQHVQLITYTGFAVLMIISVYSFFYDRAVNGKPEILSIVSNVAFALVSSSLHKLISFGFEIGVFSYFLGCFVVQLLTINWMLISVAIIFGCPLFVMHSTRNSRLEVASGGQAIHSSSHFVVIHL